MRVRHSKGLALVGACILFAMSLAPAATVTLQQMQQTQHLPQK